MAILKQKEEVNVFVWRKYIGKKTETESILNLGLILVPSSITDSEIFYMTYIIKGGEITKKCSIMDLPSRITTINFHDFFIPEDFLNKNKKPDCYKIGALNEHIFNILKTEWEKTKIYKNNKSYIKLIESKIKKPRIKNKKQTN